MDICRTATCPGNNHAVQGRPRTRPGKHWRTCRCQNSHDPLHSVPPPPFLAPTVTAAKTMHQRGPCGPQTARLGAPIRSHGFGTVLRTFTYRRRGQIACLGSACPTPLCAFRLATRTPAPTRRWRPPHPPGSCDCGSGTANRTVLVARRRRLRRSCGGACR